MPTGTPPAYREEVLHFADVLFPSIPVTYLVTMEGSARRAQYMRELREWRPSTRVVVLHNRGYRAGAKPAWVSTAALDLWHANQHIARQAPGEWVLVLEDDVQFYPRAREWAPLVERFLHGRDDVEVYNLGTIHALFASPAGPRHLRVWTAGDTHAVIYSPAARKKMTSLRVRFLHDIEVMMRLRTFIPREPLAWQRHEPTENSAQWDVLGVCAPYLRLRGGDRRPMRLFEEEHALACIGGSVSLALGLIVAAVVVACVAACRGLLIARTACPRAPCSSWRTAE